jgi:hypothetical protein
LWRAVALWWLQAIDDADDDDNFGPLNWNGGSNSNSTPAGNGTTITTFTATTTTTTATTTTTEPPSLVIQLAYFKGSAKKAEPVTTIATENYTTTTTTATATTTTTMNVSSSTSSSSTSATLNSTQTTTRTRDGLTSSTTPVPEPDVTADFDCSLSTPGTAASVDMFSLCDLWVVAPVCFRPTERLPAMPSPVPAHYFAVVSLLRLRLHAEVARTLNPAHNPTAEYTRPFTRKNCFCILQETNRKWCSPALALRTTKTPMPQHTAHTSTTATTTTHQY